MDPSALTILKADLQSFLAAAKVRVDGVLELWAQRLRGEVGGPVGEAIAYSLAGSGKRFRPALVMATYQELGGRGDVAEVAAAVEVVHTYSLVHDDLPCMDDDDLRRGRPTTHRQYGVAAATEAGFRMVPLAARVLSSGMESLNLPASTLARMGAELFDAAGARGMVGGQVLDLEAEGREIGITELENLHARKTGALIAASVSLGAMAAEADGAVLDAVRRFGREIGLAFQIADDVLDATASSSQLGKTAGKDLIQNKATFATLMGVDRARREARSRIESAMDQLGQGGLNSMLLKELAHLIINRRS
jgi:geranylgeranyl pyrophosphate synthase